VSPGAFREARPGSIAIMNEDNPSERAVALVQQALEVLLRAETAPASPVTAFLTAKKRRALRREAARLRQGKAEPRYKNLHTAEDLAALYERTVQRDEMIEQGIRDFKRITRDLDCILEENTPGLRKTMETFALEARRAAEEQGPGSEAARRYRQVQLIAWLANRQHSQRRRQRAAAPPRVAPAPDSSAQAWWREIAAEILTSPPSPDEPVIPIPPQGQDSGRERMFLRIGIGPKSWIGSFECGHTNASTVRMLPDLKHLFVAAGGAGYVIDAKSRTLVETTGTEVIAAIHDEPLTLLVVNHNGMSLEAFGKTGRLWKTGTISSGGFRRMAHTAEAVVGEARHPLLVGWTRFSVKLATGEVEIDGRGGGRE
jgi:hypothetical protein